VPATVPPAKSAPPVLVLPDTSAAPEPSAAPTPTAAPTDAEELPDETAAPRPTACIPAVRAGVLCPCAGGRLNCAAATAASEVIDVDTIDVSDGSAAGDKGAKATALPRPTACIPAVRAGVLCPCAGGRLNCAAATAAPEVTAVDTSDVSDGSSADNKGAKATALPRPTACIPAVRDGVLCPCAGGRLNCAAGVPVGEGVPDETGAPTPPRPTACIPAVRDGVLCPCAGGRLDCAAAAAAATAALAASATPVPVASVTAAPTAAPAGAVVPAAPPAACKACAAPRLVVTHVPCVQTERHLVLGCAASRRSFGHAAPVAAAPDGPCRRLVEVAVQTTCPKTQLVKECHVVPCPATEW